MRAPPEATPQRQVSSACIVHVSGGSPEDVDAGAAVEDRWGPEGPSAPVTEGVRAPLEALEALGDIVPVCEQGVPAVGVAEVAGLDAADGGDGGEENDALAHAPQDATRHRRDVQVADAGIAEGALDGGRVVCLVIGVPGKRGG